MDENLELLEYIYKDSDMSVITLEKLLQELNDKDNKIKKKTEEILKSYEDFLSKSKKLLNKFDSPLEENSYIAKIGAKMGIKKEVKSDNSDAAIADMLIKGFTMGKIDIEKKVNRYSKDAEPEILKLAKKLAKFNNENIDLLKKYL